MSYAQFHSNTINQQSTSSTQHRPPSAFSSANQTEKRSHSHQHCSSIRRSNNGNMPRTRNNIGGVTGPMRGCSASHMRTNGVETSSEGTRINRARSFTSGSRRNWFSSTSNYSSFDSSRIPPSCNSPGSSSFSATRNGRSFSGTRGSSSYSSTRPYVQWYSQSLHHNSALHLNSRQLRQDRSNHSNFSWGFRRNRLKSPSNNETIKHIRRH